jgi:type II secretory ATPase GspE/PulE/Tfp pilus assembly ATPase PilB-like protein
MVEVWQAACGESMLAGVTPTSADHRRDLTIMTMTAVEVSTDTHDGVALDQAIADMSDVIDLPTGVVDGSADTRRIELAEARRVAARYGFEFIDMDTFRIDQELFRSIPADLMLRYGFVPSRREGKTLVIVVSDPSNLPMLDELAGLLATPLKVTVGARSALDAILKKSESSQRVLEDATESFHLQLLKEEDNGGESITVERLTSDISPVIRLVDSTIYSAIQQRASDIHIETRDDGVYVKYRVDGVLQIAMRPLAKRFHSSIISRIKVMAELDIAEKRVPQDGRFRLRMNGKTIDFRVSIMPTVHGEDVVIRILDKQSLSEQFTELSLDILGYPEADLKRFRKYIAEPYGMVLVTGPTGSGKTTTLYAALSEIKTVEDKIITIEDPVEYQLSGITQIPINEKKGLTFARGLRSILRHDPDKIMVGEIRDNETAQIAINSALTGHLVFTTVHANNVFDVLGRFLNMGVEAYQFVSALNCVLAQRLIRVICTHCKRPVRISRALLEESGLDPDLERTQIFYEGAGCVECNGTGYKGRMAICELLDLTDRIRELILEKRPASEIKKAARDEGMRFLRESAVDRVMTGLTTLREINKVTFVE